MAYTYSDKGCSVNQTVLDLSKSCSLSSNGGYSESLCVSPTFLDDHIPSVDDKINNDVVPVDDDYVMMNSSYLFTYIDVSCYSVVSSKPTSTPTSIPTLAPTESLVQVAVNQVIDGTSYQSYLNASEAYIQAITQTILGFVCSKICPPVSMIIS